mmetsp:Transcript_36824/g.82835  ORF Transcript_36824/g.82835 Transcript_36824/m.82835 type:complete len:95 (-) Transcript_36824:1307-1591(-)
MNDLSDLLYYIRLMDHMMLQLKMSTQVRRLTTALKCFRLHLGSSRMLTKTGIHTCGVLISSRKLGTVSSSTWHADSSSTFSFSNFSTHRKNLHF